MTRSWSFSLREKRTTKLESDDEILEFGPGGEVDDEILEFGPEEEEDNEILEFGPGGETDGYEDDIVEFYPEGSDHP